MKEPTLGTREEDLTNGLKPISAAVQMLIANAKQAAEGESSAEPPRVERQSCVRAVDKGKICSPFWRSAVEMLNEAEEDIEYLVPGVIPSGAGILLSGREGTLKSFLVLQLSNAISQGGIWLGRQCLQGPVLYLDAEMPRKLIKKRLRGLKPGEGLHVSHHGDEGFPTSLKDPKLIEAAKQHRLIVIDPLKRFMNGREENSSTAMAELTAELRTLATISGCTVIALHHSPKQVGTSGYRGSTELGAGVDIALSVEITKTDTSKILRISTSKTRYDDEIDMALEVVRTSQGPVFNDMTKEAQRAASAASDSQLLNLRMVIVMLKEELGRAPRQSEIVEKARTLNLGSRNTILSWLKRGEGTHWRSTEDSGHSLVYEPVVQLSSCSEA